MTPHPRAPVIIGVAQISRRATTAETPNNAIALMIDAARHGVNDAAVTASDIDMIGVADGLFSHPNPAAAIGESIDAGPVHTLLTTWGGNTPIAFVGELASRLIEGTIEMGLFVGGEANASRDVMRRAGIVTNAASTTVDFPAPEIWGAPLIMANPDDIERGGEHPRNNYAIFDSALRSQAGETLDEARDRAASLWEGYSRVAGDNPHAFGPVLSAADIREPRLDNRMVSWPYTKAMCANNRVDQAGAILITTFETATRLGVAASAMVFIHETLNAIDTDSFLPRKALHHVPALAAAAAQLVERWGPIDDLDHLDLYGCFPSIVRYTAEALGISPDRELTVTGGLGFMGAPLNFAAGQSLIAMVEKLRRAPGSVGLVQGNGGQAAKHAFGVYSTSPPDALPPNTTITDNEIVVPLAASDADGAATIEGVTVEYSHTGPERAVAICRMDDGGRLWATSTDPAVMDSFVAEECVGRAVDIDAGVLQFVSG